MNVIAADVVITPGSPKQVTVRVEDSGGRAVKLIPGSGGRVSADFDGPLREGMVYVELPQGSHIELDDLSGDVAVRGVGGNVRVRATSGDLVIERPGSVDLRTVSGDVAVSDAKGQVRVRTVSGDAKVRMAAGPAARFEFDSTSGDLIFGGACGAGCRLEARSCSGDMVLGMDPASSFDLSYLSHQGDFSDGLHLAALPGPKDAERSVKRRYGHGEGLIEIETYSGDVQVRRQ
jgi:hypothetical protein